MLTNRFYRTSEFVYAAMRDALDTAWGHPNGRAVTCLPPVEEALHDTENNVVVAVLEQMTDWPEVEAMLQPAINDGLITAVTAEDYTACLPEAPGAA